jgi:NAD-dependent DNA ligase
MDRIERNFIHNELYLLWHKYLYYVKSESIVSDSHFDSATKWGEMLYEYMDKEKYPLEETVFYMVGFNYDSKYWLACKMKYNL